MGGETPAISAPHACLVAKARLCDHFNDECRRIIEQLFVRVVPYSKGQTLLNEGDSVTTIFLMCSGWAARVIDLVEGQRQITELFLPGDLFPVRASMSAGASTDSIIALGKCYVTTCKPQTLNEAALQNSELARTLWWLSQRDVSILRMWMAINGQFKVYDRIAHLVCEVIHRLRQVGLGAGDFVDFPLTQEELGEVVGATPVHVNRCLRQMSRDGLLDVERGAIEILDLGRLQKVANFDARYLSPK